MLKHKYFLNWKSDVMFKHYSFSAFVAGAFSALAFAPFYIFIAAAFSLSLFFILLEKSADRKTAIKLGFFYGFGYFLAGNYWICISLLVEPEKFAWLIPFCLTLIPSLLALYFVLFVLGYKFLINKIKIKNNYQKIIIFTLCWVICEILRANLFTGFPWNLIGYSLMFNQNMVQSASIFGVYGLGILAGMLYLLPVLLILKNNKISDKIFVALVLVAVAVNFCYGFLHIKNNPIVYDEKVKLRLVQPNIEQDLKWNPRKKYQNFLNVIALTKSSDIKDFSAVIWSETSVPYPINDNFELINKLQEAIPANGVLITGGLKLYHDDYEIKSAWNSVFLLDKSGIVDSYDKNHLVPFGEYVPLKKYFSFIDKITDGAVDFSSGNGPKTLHSQHFSFAPLICYEAIFFDDITDKKDRPDLLVNVTNDAWFGVSSGPFQHLDMTKMRAIEHGTAMARVANTGITAFIDPFGREIARIGLNQAGVLDVEMIKNFPETIYEKYGNLLVLLMIIGLAIIVVL